MAASRSRRRDAPPTEPRNRRPAGGSGSAGCRRCPRADAGWNDAALSSWRAAGGARAGRVSNSSSRGLEVHEAAGRIRDVSRRPTRRLHRELEGRVVALGAIAGCGRSTAASWHGRRAQSILEPGQPVDRLLCGQSVGNGAGERGGSGRPLPRVRIFPPGHGSHRWRPFRDLEQPGHRRLRAVQRRQPASNQHQERRNADAGHDA